MLKGGRNDNNKKKKTNWLSCYSRQDVRTFQRLTVSSRMGGDPFRAVVKLVVVLNSAAALDGINNNDDFSLHRP